MRLRADLDSSQRPPLKVDEDTRRSAVLDRELRRSTAYAMAAALAHSNRVSSIGASTRVAPDISHREGEPVCP